MQKILAAMLLITASAPAMADWGPGAHPGWGHPHQCTVHFQKCDVNVGGFCAKWNNKTFAISPRDARWACEQARREYGRIRNCSVNCY